MTSHDHSKLLTVERSSADSWVLVGPRSTGFGLVNEYLAYLSDRRYSPRTVRAYAFDLLCFCRWLVAEGTVRGHEKVPACGQIRVPAGGQIKVPAFGQMEVLTPR